MIWYNFFSCTSAALYMTLSVGRSVGLSVCLSVGRSILGPLLFLVYTDDICDYIESAIHLYADDTSLLSITPDPDIGAMDLNADLYTLQIWANQWLLTFNPKKTVSLSVSSNDTSVPLPGLYLNDVKIQEVHHHSHLGLTFSENMSWKDHIDALITKANKRLGTLQYFKYTLSRNVLDYLYKTLVLSLFDYGDILYNSCNAVWRGICVRNGRLLMSIKNTTCALQISTCAIYNRTCGLQFLLQSVKILCFTHVPISEAHEHCLIYSCVILKHMSFCKAHVYK